MFIDLQNVDPANPPKGQATLETDKSNPVTPIIIDEKADTSQGKQIFLTISQN